MITYGSMSSVEVCIPCVDSLGKWHDLSAAAAFFGHDGERGHMDDEEYARWLQQQIDLEDYWHNRLQESDYSPEADSRVRRTDRSEHAVPTRRVRFHAILANPENENSYETYWELQERNGDVKNGGMSQDAIDRFPTSILTKTNLMLRPERSECSVCMETFQAGEVERVLKCFHSFHVSCIDKWLLKNATCPVCRESTLPEHVEKCDFLP